MVYSFKKKKMFTPPHAGHALSSIANRSGQAQINMRILFKRYFIPINLDEVG